MAQASDADRTLPGYDEAVGIWLYVTVFETRSPDARRELLAVARKHLETSASNTKEAIAAMMVMIEWYAKDPDLRGSSAAIFSLPWPPAKIRRPPDIPRNSQARCVA